MNWGYKILLVICLFILGMLSMVFIAFKQTNEMMDANYYEKEMKFQQIIDASNNLSNVTNDTLLSQTTESIIVNIPPNICSQIINGEVQFIKTDNKKYDFTEKITKGNDKKIAISKNNKAKGIYNARISWENNNIKYYKEENIKIE